MKNIIFSFVLGVWWFSAACAQDVARFSDSVRQEFSPARGDVYKIPFVLDRSARVKIEILTSDGHLIRKLDSTAVLPKGKHFLFWDGKDADGVTVPDEAYIPVLEARSEGETVRIDPREFSGGEIIEDVHLEKNDLQSYSYRLPAAARVSIRSGIDGGPLLKVLADWEPHAAGRNLVYWDGMDADHLVDLGKTGRMKLVVAAFRLPRHSIIATGNDKITYRDWYRKKNWPLRSPDLSAVKLVRGETGLSLKYFIPVLMNKSPLVRISLPDDLKKDAGGRPVFSGGVLIRVDMDEDSKWSLQDSRYEVGFFIDNDFVSEEEQGYMPLTWKYRPEGLEPGVHVLTVNISGFRGQVGVKSLEFTVP